jgi:pimeloyl-ACP methyl ester carboxylesterase
MAPAPADRVTDQVVVHYGEHGADHPVLVLHGGGVDHRETEAYFEPLLEGVARLRRIYPDLPGMGRTIAPETLCSAADVLDALIDFADQASGGTAHLLIGHSAPPDAFRAEGVLAGNSEFGLRVAHRSDPRRAHERSHAGEPSD